MFDEHRQQNGSMSETRKQLRIGVLAIQGAFFEHRAALLKAAKNSTFSKDIEVEVVDIREPDQLLELDGLILPGGESTTMSLFLQSSNFEEVLKEWVASKEKPKVVWGTCAGLILLSNDIEAQKEGGQSKVFADLLKRRIGEGGGGIFPYGSHFPSCHSNISMIAILWQLKCNLLKPVLVQQIYSKFCRHFQRNQYLVNQ